MCYSKHFTYSTTTEIDLAWKWELKQVERWEKDHGIKLYHNDGGVWYDAEGNNGFKVVRPDADNFRTGKYSDKQGGVKVKGTAWQHTYKADRYLLEMARLYAGCPQAGGQGGNVGADIKKGKDGKWYAVGKEEEQKKQVVAK